MSTIEFDSPLNSALFALEKYPDRVFDKTLFLNMKSGQDMGRLYKMVSFSQAVEEAKTTFSISLAEENCFRSYSFKYGDLKATRKLGMFAANPLVISASIINYNGMGRASALFSVVKDRLVPINEFAVRMAADPAISAGPIGVFQTAAGIQAQKRKMFGFYASIGGPRVAAFIDPETIVRTFKHREIPAGMTRRQCLLHIVSSHSRRIPDKEEFITIQSYLRGAKKCSINGVDIELFGPKIDDYAKFQEECRLFLAAENNDKAAIQ